jgi:hypothetical protein
VTARVISLDAKRRNPAPGCGCPQHQLEALAERIRYALDAHAAELLIPAPTFTAALTDAAQTIASALGVHNGGMRPDARR